MMCLLQILQSLFHVKLHKTHQLIIHEGFPLTMSQHSVKSFLSVIINNLYPVKCSNLSLYSGTSFSPIIMTWKNSFCWGICTLYCFSWQHLVSSQYSCMYVMSISSKMSTGACITTLAAFL